ncbi:flagellar basal-body MS-ring/collar protein FliF [Algicella marina]|uniref:Flagellar M-ring protein n=1 Tax=Algicella marina TaxID=2683284 RepID=A0A6P1T4Y1_9RHOB|nr:flagellar basal-body MS-ring/collar protein FliF [Algicella marina]QHQ36805.1 flagellar M-ring protein FliF [Algicella marina]
MTQILSNWDALDGRRKLVIVLSVAAAILAMVGIGRIASQPDMALLYGGLDPASAGEVIAALEQQGTMYEVRGNAIFTPSTDRDQTRLTLAGQGLPTAGGVGYELLDSMTGFGTTSQMFDAAYWRAKEGELARTILASREIRAARVHIANPQNQPFSRKEEPSASITVTMARGQLSGQQAEAIRHLVSAAVSGLPPRSVAVIDSEAGVILGAGESEVAGLAAQNATMARAETMKSNIERLLAARVGPGRAVVEVNIDADMDSETISERIVDPTSRVTVSSDTEEKSDSSSGSGSGGVTVASNLPDGDTDATGGSSNSSSALTRERLNFEVSETRRERVTLPGQIRKISVAVIVDGISETAADGSKTWKPRPEEELTALRALVESAVGFDPARGDVVTLETLKFPETGGEGTLMSDGSGGFLSGDMIRLLQTAVLGLVAIILGLFVVRPLLSKAPEMSEPELAGQQVEILAEGADVTADIEMAANEEIEDAERSKLKNLRNVISDRSEESAAVLRRWIEAPENTRQSTS